MRVMFINNTGAGFADQIDIEPDTTIEKFLSDHLPHIKPDDMLIRINRMPVTRDQVIQEGDRISATPSKVEGARRIAA